MIKTILTILVGIIGGVLLNAIKGLIFEKSKQILSDNIPAIKKIEEEFNSSKLKDGLLALNNKVLWGKTTTQEYSLRTWIARIPIILIIVGAIYGYGVWKGKQGIQPILNLAGKEEWISLNEHFLHIKRDGSLDVVAGDKKTVLKKITIKDVSNLKNQLKPFGFRHDVVGVLGLGIGLSGNKLEAGAGLAWFKYHNWRTDISITNRAIYPVGISYKVTENSAFGISYGFGYKKDNRILIKYTWEI